jgi:hypothetical protein
VSLLLKDVVKNSQFGEGKYEENTKWSISDTKSKVKPHVVETAYDPSYQEGWILVGGS